MTRRSRTTRRGMTLPELVIGTMMLGIIGTALASFTMAMAAGWENSDRRFKVENAAKRSADVLEATLSNMLYVAQNKTWSSASPSSYVFYWAQDGGLVATDKKAQLGEMALIEFDSANKTIWIYKAKTSLNAGQTTTLSADNWGDPTAPAIVTYFKGLDSVEKTPLVGGTSSGIDIESANFSYVTPAGSKSMTAYSMRLTSGNAQDSSAGTIPMRARKKPTNFS